ncbi:NAD(P)/FAD-dependent oxidoreductase [Aestuariirhabdus litorea]|uniref:FAD-binding oxidoreductase n=1 Tax=Aestuariirhabdus litorea TaxID=2528527 RepID=A0A3P3VNZ6_9GAMM|nr:FAD-binding oxidoreductase [Aestuariirhabdus litorea]RRJ84425.1 FAD-binding oxidoreductase [Aestuariirhabdus litorea]RWW97649.1 FAD-dependent oxidoreductase [Endozoicomonadaceae bacterium GTF-13]
MNAPVHTDQHAPSYYLASANRHTEYPRLEGSLSADVCVVGGGFTGVSTALNLAERGYRVILLEARKLSWGATGRNGGQLIRGIGHGAEQFRNEIGSEGVEAIFRMGLEAVEIVRHTVAKYDIDCDLTWGYFDAATRPRHMKELQESFDELSRYQYAHEIRMLDRSEIPSVVGSDMYIGGMIDMGSGHVHPLNLCLGEAAAAEQMGAQFFEYSPAIRIEHGSKPVVHTEHGSVSADFVVLGGNAYIGDLEPRIAGKVLPAGSYVIATEPLPEAVHRRLIPQNMAICDQRVALDYYRLSADKRLLFGGMCNYSGREPASIKAAMQPKMLKVFPELADVRIDYEWGGNIGIGANRMPQLGRLSDNVIYAQAYSGHGVNATHMMGRLIADMISGQAERFDVFARIKHMTFPGGKHLRSPLLAAGMLYYRFMDLF